MNKYKFEIHGSDKTKNAFKSVGRNIRKVSNQVGKSVAAVGSVVAAGMAAIYSHNSKVIDELGKMADRLNATTEGLAAYHHLTELNGESTESFDKSITKMVRGIGEAERGFGTAGIALKSLGIDVNDLKNLKADEQFAIIAEQIKGVETQTEQASLAADIFGRSGIGLLNTINQGADAFADAKREVELFGVSLNRIDAAKVEEANDASFKIKQLWSGFGRQMTVQMAPVITLVSEKLQEAILSMGGMGKVSQKVIGGAVRVVGVFADGWHGIKIILKGVELVIRGVISGFSELVVFAIENMATMQNSILKGLVWPLKKGLEIMALLPGSMGEMAAESIKSLDDFTDRMQVKVPDALNDFRAAQREAFQETGAEIQALLLQDLPSNVIKERISAVMDEADERIKAKIQKIRGDSGVGGEDEEADKDRERYEAKLERVTNQYATELELLKQKKKADLEILQEGFDSEYLSEEEHKKKKAKLDEFYAKKSQRLKAAENKSMLAMTSGVLGAIANIQNTKSKSLFKIQKAAALANAAVTLPSAVIKSYDNGGGYPWGLIPAGLMLAAGIAQIQDIKKTNFGGGGSVSRSLPSGGGASVGGAPSTPTANSNRINDLGLSTPQAERAPVAPVINFHVTGDLNSNDASTFLNDVKDMITTGDFVLIEPTSRNGQELGAT